MSITRKEAIMKGAPLKAITREEALLLGEDIYPLSIDDAAIKSQSEDRITWIPVTVVIDTSDIKDEQAEYVSSILYLNGFGQSKQFNEFYIEFDNHHDSGTPLNLLVPCFDGGLVVQETNILIPYPIFVYTNTLKQFADAYNYTYSISYINMTDELFVSRGAINPDALRLVFVDSTKIDNWHIIAVKFGPQMQIL